VDNQGTSLHLKGHRIKNQMILKSKEFHDKNVGFFYYLITWTANRDGTVRQLWETIKSTNERAVAFDGLYKKVKTD
jgi:hypothetical protein